MLRTIASALLAGLVVSCGGVDVIVIERHPIPADLQPLVQEFKADAHEHGRQLRVVHSVEWTDSLPNHWIGMCEMTKHFDGVNVIVERRVYILRSYAPASLKAVIYHELGHCALGLQHSSDSGSVMWPYASSEDPTVEQINTLMK